MRRTGHIRKRSNGSWELRYSLGTDIATGRRRVATATVKGSRRVAEKELRRLLRTLDTGEHVDPTRMTVREWLITWLNAVKAEIAPKSFERYSEIVHHFLAPELGALPMVKLGPVHIQAAYTKWAAGGRRDRKQGGLSPRTRRHIHRILKSALSRAVEQQVLARNPVDAFKKRLPKGERRQMARSCRVFGSTICDTAMQPNYWRQESIPRSPRSALGTAQSVRHWIFTRMSPPACRRTRQARSTPRSAVL
jgi:hypothetical protein